MIIRICGVPRFINRNTCEMVSCKLLHFFSTTATTPINEGYKASAFRVAVIGAGPSGFYCAKYLLANEINQKNAVHLDMFDALPTPFGLVRFGIAPDHPEVKNVENDFRLTMSNERFRFFGNVKLGTDITVQNLLDHYHAVVLATGAAGERKLGIDGENLIGVHSARDFVHWYNGHPDFFNNNFDLKHETAVIIGNGNVAMDVARILLKPPAELAPTDIAVPALAALRESMVRRVLIVARRGPAQAAFSRKEFKELAKLHGVKVRVDQVIKFENGDADSSFLVLG
jgi:NADPH-dependent glutamate synthase beta subunit-like oxidoreductase